MLEFFKLTLDDIDKLKHYFPYSVNRICDNTVGGAFMWRDYFSVEYAEYNETVIFKAKVKYHKNITAFSAPLGKDYHGCIKKIAEYCRANDMPVVFSTVTVEDIEVLRSIFSEFSLFKEADWSDYVYHAHDLTNLAGRKFSGQRNHMNFFKNTYENHTFEEITNSNLSEVRGFYTELSSKFAFDTDISAEEHNKTIEVLDNFDTYGLFGGLLRVDGSVVAFSIGEINNNVLFIHIEKADLQYRGAYNVVNNEFAKHFTTQEVKYINREEDVGDEGLRKSKLSYHPCEIIDKYVMVVQL